MDITVRIKDNPENRIVVCEYDHNEEPWFELYCMEGGTTFEVRLSLEQVQALRDSLNDKLAPRDLPQPEDMVNTDGAYLKLVLVRPSDFRA
jgi:hypothetical protein